MKHYLITIVLCVYQLSQTYASHFRSAISSWRVIEGRTIELTQETGWNNIGGSCVNWGDNTPTECGADTIISSGVDLLGNNWVVYRAVRIHTYLHDGPFTAVFSGCCRSGGMRLGSGNSWRVAVRIDLRNGNKGGPGAFLAPSMVFPSGENVSLDLSPSDPDCQTVKCRKSTDAESDISGLDSSNIFDISEDCILTTNIPGNYPQGSLWATQIVMYTMDNNSNIVDSTAMDFLITSTSGTPPLCEMLNVVPECGLQINIGETMTINWKATPVSAITETL
eukprot:85241_1